VERPSQFRVRVWHRDEIERCTGANLCVLGVWRSLVARSVRVGEVPSSNLGTPIETRGNPGSPVGPSLPARSLVGVFTSGGRDGCPSEFPNAAVAEPRRGGGGLTP
jgi:hypothetical protein